MEKTPWLAALFPSEISKYSAGFGLYFWTLVEFAALMLLASAVAIWPLIDNLQNNRYTSEYWLPTSAPAASVSVGAEANLVQDADSIMCDKQFEVSSYILDTSLGAQCIGDGDRFTSVFDCPAVCLLNATKANEPRCQRFPVQGETCNSRTPCPVGLDPLQSNRDLSVYCNCCDLKLLSAEAGDVPTAQIWLWAVLFTFIFGVWHISLQALQAALAERYNMRNITAADYAVWITGIGGVDSDEARIEDFGRHYGHVVMAFHVLSLGPVLSLCNKIEEDDLALAELRLLVSGAPPSSGRFCGCSFLANWLYKRWLCGFASPARACAALSATLDKRQRLLKSLQAAPLRPTGNAIVVFDYEAHAQNMRIDHQRLATGVVASWLRNIFPVTVVRRFHRLTGGMFSRAPRMTVAINGVETERFVTVQRAPEPSDVWWENTRAAGKAIPLRRTVAWLVYAVALGISFVIQFLVVRRAEDERLERIVYDRADATGVSPQSDTALDIDSLYDSARLRAFTFLQGIVVTVINLVVGYIIEAVSLYEQHVTTTSYLAGFITKLTFFFLLNSFVVPILAVATLRGSNSAWYASGGVVEAAFTIQLFNAVLPDALSLADPIRIFQFHVLSRFARSQAYLDFCVAPVEFSLPLRFAGAIRTIALAILYAPILPISPFIGVFSIALSYATDLLLARTVSEKPKAFDSDAFDMVNFILRLLPFAQLLLIFLLYYADHRSETLGPFIAGMLIWGFFSFVPVRQGFGCNRDKDTESGGTENLRFSDVFPKHIIAGSAAQHGPNKHGAAAAPALKLMEAGEKRVHAEGYYPQGPGYVDPAWTTEATRHFRFIDPIKAPILDLLANQKAKTGGEIATQAPEHVEGAAVEPAALGHVPSGLAASAQPGARYPVPVYTITVRPKPHSAAAAASQPAARPFQAHAPRPVGASVGNPGMLHGGGTGSNAAQRPPRLPQPHVPPLPTAPPPPPAPHVGTSLPGRYGPDGAHPPGPPRQPGLYPAVNSSWPRPQPRPYAAPAGPPWGHVRGHWGPRPFPAVPAWGQPAAPVQARPPPPGQGVPGNARYPRS